MSFADEFKPEKTVIKTVYLAGFDVFHPEAIALGHNLTEICTSFGLEGRYPMDNEINLGPNASKEETGQAIAWANYEMLYASDAIIANVNSFRGHEPDSGTCAEIGFAVCCKKPIFLYTADLRTLIDRIPSQNGIDEHGYCVEDFGFPLNIMLACPAIHISKSFEEAVEMASRFHLE
ncbi:nucleoside 2-deoxyribosyltransferase [Pseudomonas luteola]